MNKTQPVSAKIGEVKFRKKLVLQHKGIKRLLNTTTNEKDILKYLGERIPVSAKIFESLSQQYSLTPYLEIGSEKCQRASVLETRFNAFGFALDISYDSLESASFFLPKLQLKKMPLRICADANYLPFAKESFPFVFCFQTLHHFPDPKPILKELKRVLQPEGVFYFSEEPLMQQLNLNLWRRDFHLTAWEKILKSILILPFLSTIGKSETEHGVLEETFDLPTWKEALNLFSYLETTLTTYPEIIKVRLNKKNGKKDWLKIPFPQNIFFTILGGAVESICRKSITTSRSPEPKLKKIDLYRLLACPVCHLRIYHYKNKSEWLFCKSCQAFYPSVNGVFFLMPEQLFKKLYPDVFDLTLKNKPK